MGRHPARRHASPDDAPIGDRIRRRRRELGMTQADLAGAAYTKSFISQLESGHADPSVDTLRYLSRRLQTALSTLAGGTADQRLSAVEGLLAWAGDALRAGDTAGARRVAGLAAEIASAAEADRHMAEAGLLLAEVEIEAGDPDRAALALDQVPEAAVARDPRVAVRKDLAQGSLALRRGDPGGAVAAFQRALDRSRRTTRLADLTVRALTGLGEALTGTGDLKGARRRFQAAERATARVRR